MIRRPPKLRTFITGLILLVIIPSLLLTLYNANRQHRAAIQTAQDQLGTLVQLVVSEQNQLLGGTRQLLMSLAQLPVVHEVVVDYARAGHCQRVLSNLLTPHPYYNNFGVADVHGEMHCSALGMPHPVNIRDRLYFQRSMANKGFGIGEFQIGRITGKPAINLSYPITNAHGNIGGVVFAALSLDWLGRLIHNAPLPADTTLQVIDSNGRLLAQYPEPAHDAGAPAVSTSLYRQILRHTGKQSLVLQDVDNIHRFYAYAPLLDEEGGIYVAASVEYAKLTAEVNAHLLRNIILLTLLTLVIFSLAWVYSHNLFLRRIQALIRGAERLRRGQLEARSGVTHGSDELGYLAQAFDSMAESLQGQQRELELTSENLQLSIRALQALSACNRTLIHATDEQQLLDKMCRIIVDNGGYLKAWIGRARDQQDRPIDVLAHAGMTEEDLTTLTCSRGADAPGCIPAVDAVRDKRVTISRDAHTVDAQHLAPGHQTPHAIIALPLRLDTHQGVLNIYAEEHHAFDDQEVRLLEEMADDIAFGIHTLADRARRQSAEAHIHHLAYYDPLTDLPNRYFLEERLTQLVQNSGAPLAVMMININRFNEINNTIGYSHADTVLKMIGPRLREILPPDTFIARTGGDIFAVLLTGCNHSAALAAAHEIQTVSTQDFRLADINLTIDVSIGITLYPDHGGDAVTLIRRTSLAMHMASHSPDDIFTYDPMLDQDGPRRLTLAADLRRALENADGQLQLHVQPKVDIPTRQIISVEALCRWQHPVHGPVSPGEFIPLAEHTGLIMPLTMWVLQAAIDHIQRWRTHGIELPIAVNLSARNLYQPGLVTHITRLCRINDIPMHMLELELTESALMQYPEQCQATLQALHELGIMLYIDDYGTGYSSLGYIKRLPMKAIKIDMSFVKDMQHSAEAETIVKSTIAMAHELGMTVVAEGVENEVLFDKLAALGCDQAQGYYIARPQAGDEFIAWLQDSTWQPARPANEAGKTRNTQG